MYAYMHTIYYAYIYMHMYTRMRTHIHIHHIPTWAVAFVLALLYHILLDPVMMPQSSMRLAVCFGGGWGLFFKKTHLFLETIPWALHLTKASGLYCDSKGTFIISTTNFAEHILDAFNMNSSHFIDCSCRILLQNFNYTPSNYDIKLLYINL